MNSRLSKAQQKAIREGKLVETANALDLSGFSARFCDTKDITDAKDTLKEKTGMEMNVILLSARLLKLEYNEILESCFRLIEQSSADDYRASESKWSPSSKRKEMVLPDMKYLVVRDNGASEDDVDGKGDDSGRPTEVYGFVSFMITYEDGYEVAYVYEIHLAPRLRGQGVGTVLMQLVEGIGRNAGVSKSMLTVFKANKKAVKWYKHHGYSVDDFSPGPRMLRNGIVKEPSYLILSKALKDLTDSSA